MHTTPLIPTGFDIHVVFSTDQTERALTLYQNFLSFLTKHKISFHNQKVFHQPVGPWPLPMWQVILSTNPKIHEELGRCISWFMLNRDGFSVMIHPNTEQVENKGGAYEDHSQHHLWLGTPITLNMAIFTR